MRSVLHIPPTDTPEFPIINGVKESIARVLVYFDIFHYPLSAAEIRQFLDCKSSETDLHEALAELLKEKKIFLQNGFFSLQQNSLLNLRRQEGNKRAEKLLKKAGRIGRLLYRFPFVRAVGISGSLSKNFADEKADIDFFIITKASRLWIARSFLHLYKKLTFITGRQHFHCMNYFIDEDALVMEDQNIFTAIEIKTLVPVCGSQLMQLFFDKNNWTDEWLPALPNKKQQKKNPLTWIKQIAEWILNGKAGTRLEKFLLKLTSKRWERKELRNKKNIKGQTMGFICGKHFAMSNPGNFREKVLSLYKQKLEEQNISCLNPGVSFSVVR